MTESNEQRGGAAHPSILVGLRRLAIVGVLAGSCTGFMDPVIEDPDTFECSPYEPVTRTFRYPDSLRLVVGSADMARIDRSVEDGCSYQEVPVPGLVISARDTSVVTATSAELNGARIVPKAAGSTWIVFEADDLIDSIPVVVPDTFALGRVVDISARGDLTCAVEETDRVLCWGSDFNGLLGDFEDPGIGTCYGIRCSPMPKPIGEQAEQVFVASFGACFLEAGGLECQTGDTREVWSDLGFVSVSGTWSHKCGLTDAGSALCWGDSHYGQLGLGAGSSYQTQPQQVLGPETWSSVTTRDGTSCGIAEGRLYCWGLLPTDFVGAQQCQTGTTGKDATPTFGPCASVPTHITMGTGLGADTILVDVAGDCVLTTQGGVLCAPTGSSRFARVADPGSFETIVAGSTHYCGLTSDGAARCWGDNYLAQLGAGDSEYEPRPVSVWGGHQFTDLALGAVHSCGLTVDSEVWCWGFNGAGQAGGSILDEIRVPPTRVRGQGTP